MQVIIVERDNGIYTDPETDKKYMIWEAPDGTTVNTNHPVESADSADAYADAQGWVKDE